MRYLNIFAIFLLAIVHSQFCLAAVTLTDIFVIEDIYWKYYSEKYISSEKSEGTSSIPQEGTSGTQPEGTSSTHPEGTSGTQPEGTSSTQPEGTSSIRHKGTSDTQKEGTSSGLQEVICNLEQEKIYGLCKNILQDINIQFNHAAYFFLKPTCEEKKITFTVKKVPEDKEIKTKMMPCYGRSQPMRTSWVIDDNFDFIWIADGPGNNSLVVFTCKAFADSKPCLFYKLIRQHKIEEVDTYIVEKSRVQEELATLKQLSFNTNPIEIDAVYITEMIHILDICQLQKEEKLLLCEKILNRLLYNYWIAMKGVDDALNCMEKRISFSFVGSSTTPEINDWMFPCYGQSKFFQAKKKQQGTDLFYLSSGPTHNSIIVYHQASNRIITIAEVFEYINIQRVLSNNASAMIAAEMFSHHDSSVTEEIYLNEIFKDPVCDLPTKKKYSLCLMFAARSIYDDFNWTINEAEFQNSEVTCEAHQVLLLTGVAYNNVGNVMMMFPCYGKHSKREDNVIAFYKNPFYFSKGPRKNSVMVYKHINNAYVVHEIMENVNFEAL